jgi:hypothetical protein
LTEFPYSNKFEEIPSQSSDFIDDVDIQLKHATHSFNEFKRRIAQSIFASVVSLKLFVKFLNNAEQMLGDFLVNQLTRKFFK